ncbi:MAG TPA: GNAT family N-acetyltransferase [Phycisphaerae bacterium]|nr:GNAT family N-acetyltransferase [Phycisphaerae bacterium]
MTIQSPRTKGEHERFANFGREVYRDQSKWVPPDSEHIVAQLSGCFPGADQTQYEAFWVLDTKGRILATVAAVVSESFNRHWKEAIGHLAYFEALPGHDEAGTAVLRATCDWLRERGCRAARLSFFPGWQFPLTIDAYDAVPTFLHAMNPPRYHSIIKNAGFATERSLVEYRIAFTDDLAAEYRRMIDKAGSAGVELRSWNFARLDQETARFCEINNECFARHWGIPQFTVEELSGLTVGLRDFLVADFTGFAEVGGEIVGYVYATPDLNQAFHAMKGKDPAADADEFQRRLGKTDHGMLLIIGVRKPWRGRGINLALAARSYLAMIDRGYKSASYTLVLDDNWPSRRTAEKLGGQVARNFVVYRREIDGPAEREKQ